MTGVTNHDKTIKINSYESLYYDQDGDGRLGYDDFLRLIKIKATNTTDAHVSPEGFDELCEVLGAPDKLITMDQLYTAYIEVGFGSIEHDWDKLKHPRTKVWWQTSVSHCNIPDALHFDRNH